MLSLQTDKEEGEYKKGKNINDNISLSLVCQSIQNYSTIAGGSNGKLFAFVFGSELLSIFTINKILLNQMGNGREYSVETGAVSKIESTTDKRFIFTSSSFDQWIIHWFFIIKDSFWNLDFYPIPMSTLDPFIDIIPLIAYQELKVGFWKSTMKSIVVFNNALDESTKILVALVNLQGKRASDKRNNLTYVDSNKTIYSIPSYIVYFTISSNKNLTQEFFVPIENTSFNIQMEVACFIILYDQKETASLLNSNTTSLSRWKLATQLNLSKVDVDHCSEISIIKYSYNQAKLIAGELHKDHYARVCIIDVKRNQLISSLVLVHTIPCTINDIDFINNTSNDFYTVSNHHFVLWNLRGRRHMEYCRYLPLKLLKLFSDEDNIGNTNTNANYSKSKNYNNNNKEPNTDISKQNKYSSYIPVEDSSKIDHIANSIFRENPDANIKCTVFEHSNFHTFSILLGDDSNLYTLLINN